MHETEPEYLNELNLRIRAGDRAAENALVEQYSAPLLDFLRRATGDRGAAEDLHQDVFLAVILRLRRKELSDPGAMFGFIRRVAAHKLADYRAEARRHAARAVPLDEAAPSDAPDSLTLLLDAESMRLLRRVIATLPAARDRTLLHRLLVLHDDRAQVQRDLALTDAAFHRVMHRVRERVRDRLKKVREG